MGKAIKQGLALLLGLFVVLGVFGLVLELLGVGNDDVIDLPETASTESPSEPAGEPEPAPEPEAPAEPDSGPVDELDLLSQECTNGDVLACDALYWLSPVGSDLEDQGEPYALLLMFWNETAPSEKSNICLEWNAYGSEAGTAVFLDNYNAEGGGAAINIQPFEVETFFDWACVETV